MDIKENSLWYKLRRKLVPISLTAAVLILVWRTFGNMLPGLIPLIREGNEREVAAYISRESGWKGVVLVLLLSGIQVASVVLPGMAIQVAAGLIYPWWQAFVLCYFGFVAANVIIFVFARSVGSRGGTNRLSKVSMGKAGVWVLEKLKKTKPQFMVGVACLIPAIPNGIVPYLAATSTITTVQFGLAVASGCWIQILANCIAGSFLIRGQFLFTILAMVFQIAVIGLVVWKREWFLSRMH